MPRKEDRKKERDAGPDHLLLDHELVALQHQLQLVPAGPQGGQGVQAAASHRTQQTVLLLRTLELRQDLRTHTHTKCMVTFYVILFMFCLQGYKASI